jgi:hypothetical protein
MALLGGLALSVWKHVRATQDVDVLIGIKNADVDKLHAALLDAGFLPRTSSPLVQLKTMRVLQLGYEPQDSWITVRVDLLLVDSEYHEEALRRRVPVRLPSTDIEVSVLSCEDMILHKLVAGRLIDLADAAALWKLNRESLDRSYLQRWASALHLERELARLAGEQGA